MRFGLWHFDTKSNFAPDLWNPLKTCFQIPTRKLLRFFSVISIYLWHHVITKLLEWNTELLTVCNTLASAIPEPISIRLIGQCCFSKALNWLKWKGWNMIQILHIKFKNRWPIYTITADILPTNEAKYVHFSIKRALMEICVTSCFVQGRYVRLHISANLLKLPFVYNCLFSNKIMNRRNIFACTSVTVRCELFYTLARRT